MSFDHAHKRVAAAYVRGTADERGGDTAEGLGRDAMPKKGKKGVDQRVKGNVKVRS